MFNSTKAILGLAAGSAVLSGLSYWWWTRLIVGSLAACIGGEPGPGVDCRHAFQFNAALLFAAITLLLLVVAVIRFMRRAPGPAA